MPLFEGKDVQGNEIITVHFQDLMLDCLQEFANFVGMITLPLWVSWTQVKIRSRCSAMWWAQKQCSFRRSLIMHSGARQEICIILTQMMILFIGELNRSGRRFRPEKISEYENRANGRRWTTGSPRSLVTVNMTLRNGVIISVCMGNTSILRNSSK